MSYSGAIDGLPAAGVVDSLLLRNYLVKRVIHPLADAEDPEAFEALDAETGAISEAIAWHSTIFWLDPDDTTSAHDGTTVLVTADGYRYKIPEYTGLILSVLDKDLTAPVSSPTPVFGDAYLVPAAATGDWAGHTDDVAVFTARGWKFIIPKIGRILHVEDEDAYYHYSAAGEWVAGFGDSLLSDNAVLPQNVLGGRTHWVVENQTTNDPPTSPGDGVAYIVGPSPTGDWAGHAGKIAIARSEIWIIVTPSTGWTAYDKGQNNDFVFRASAWQSAAGSYVSRYADLTSTSLVDQTIEDNGLRTSNGTHGYAFSFSSAPTASALGRAIDLYQPSISAKRAGAEFELLWSGSLNFDATHVGISSGDVSLQAIAVFVDAEATARAWLRIFDTEQTLPTVNAVNSPATDGEVQISARRFVFTLADTAAHTVKIRFFARVTLNGGTSAAFSALRVRSRSVIIREAA